MSNIVFTFNVMADKPILLPNERKIFKYVLFGDKWFKVHKITPLTGNCK